MVKTLTRHGNSLALILDRPILDLLKIEPDTPLEIRTDGSSLIVSPVRDEAHVTDFERGVAEANARYGKALKNLAK